MADWSDPATLVLPMGRESLNGAKRELVSPIDGDVFATVPDHGAADVDAAVARARAAFEDGRWSRLAPAERKAVMVRWADLVERDAEMIARLDTVAMGMPRRLSEGYGVRWMIDGLRWFGEAIDKVYDEIAPTPESALALIRREPVGVVAAVVPWNWPIGLAGWKLGPALAAGCSVVAKPDEKTPLSLLRVAELGREAGLPDGVLEIVTGSREVGEALGRHMDVDVLTFTGSTRVGQIYLGYAAESNGKATWLELGGKGPHIVFADALDLDAAAQAAAMGIFLNSGQVCAAGSRLLVQRSIKDAFLDRVKAATAQLRAADPRLDDTMLGAVSSAAHRDNIESYLEVARDEGARVVGGERALEDTGGFYLQPAILDGVTPGMRVAREEIFGPALAVTAFNDEAEAIRIANDSVYGLAGGLWTADLDRAVRVSRRLRMGSVSVNTYGDDAHAVVVPFGGYKQSGYGRDKSLHALDKYVQLKTTWIKIRG